MRVMLYMRLFQAQMRNETKPAIKLHKRSVEYSSDTERPNNEHVIYQEEDQDDIEHEELSAWLKNDPKSEAQFSLGKIWVVRCNLKIVTEFY